MRQYWFKVYSPEHDETRILWMDIPEGNDIHIFEQLKNDVRWVFKLAPDYDFYFIHKDNDNDDVAIKENHEVLNYMFRMEDNRKLKLSIAPAVIPATEHKTTTTNEQTTSSEQTRSDDSNSSAALSESFQSIMKHLELGMSNLQATVEKSAATVATNTVETVVKTAAETAASVYRSLLPLTDSLNSEKPQFDVICDGCYTPIRGQRWRCETCDDFDLCSTCKCRVNHNQTHNFRLIKKETSSYAHEENIIPDQKDTSSCGSNSAQTIFICDYCDSDIVGIRHTCGACPDFDLCHSCFAIVKENHPEHIFVTRLVGAQAYRSKKSSKNPMNKKLKPSSLASSSKRSFDQQASNITKVHHLGVKCDNCQQDIHGIRFKCGHCNNYDLCETCEEDALSFHESQHAFIKIRYPIQSISGKAILPRFIPLGEKMINKEMESINQKIPINIEKSVVSSSASQKSLLVPPPPSVPATVTTTTSNSSSSASLPIVVPEQPEEPKLSATFVSDINVPDGTTIVPKKTFIKMWKIMNNGNVDWPMGTHLLFTGGSILRPHPISRPDSFVVPVVSPRDETCITAELRAPDCAGEYSSYFSLCTPDGVRFGDTLWCSIMVDQEQDEAQKMSRTVSAEDIMMNSSNSMIYPTISTESSFHQLPLESESNDGYTDQDQYSEATTNDRISIMTSNLSYTNSHVSSPATSELDMGDRHRDRFFPESVEENGAEAEEIVQSPAINPEYQVISPAVSMVLTQGGSAISEHDNDSDDEFIMIENQDDTSEEKPHSASGINSLASSSHTITPGNEHISDEVTYRSQLLKLHEMGFTNCDDLAISLLKLHQGRVEDVIAKLLYYP